VDDAVAVNSYVRRDSSVCASRVYSIIYVVNSYVRRDISKHTVNSYLGRDSFIFLP